MSQINTNKVLNNRWNTGGGQTVLSGTISISPDVTAQYDYALTDDPVLLNERKNTAELMYDVFKASPYFDKYGKTMKKVDKDDIKDIIRYFCKKITEKKHISNYELFLSICEFFDFNYDYIWNEVASIPMKSDILESLYKNRAKIKKEIINQPKLF